MLLMLPAFFDQALNERVKFSRLYVSKRLLRVLGIIFFWGDAYLFHDLLTKMSIIVFVKGLRRRDIGLF